MAKEEVRILNTDQTEISEQTDPLQDFESMIVFNMSRSIEQTLPESDVNPGAKVARKVGAVARRGGGFVAYFMVNDPVHDSQHVAFCSALDIEAGTEYKEFFVFTPESIAVLEREPQTDADQRVHGLLYNLTAVIEG